LEPLNAFKSSKRGKTKGREDWNDGRMAGRENQNTGGRRAEKINPYRPSRKHERGKGEGKPYCFFVPSNFRAFVIRFAFELADS
jgi:hypothetical protein